MGINSQVGLFDASWVYYAVIIVMAAIAPLTIGVAKHRDWI
jgi:hypothetical protein